MNPLFSQVQYFAISVSIILLFSILFLIHKKRIKEEYSIIWLLTSIAFVILSFWIDGLEQIAQFLGIDYAPAALFIILFVAVFLILIQFSIIISKQSEMIKTLVQEIGIMKSENEKIN